MDAVSISALILSIITAVGAFISHLHLRKVKVCCIESDCFKSQSEPSTPIIKK